MAGVPHHSLQGHLATLVGAGHRVAIMDQLEDPKTAKGLVKRGLSRIVTPGTCLDEETLEPTGERLLVALTAVTAPAGLAALDVSTGRCWVEYCPDDSALAVGMARFQAAEIVLPQKLFDDEHTFEILEELLETDTLPPSAPQADAIFDAKDSRRWLCEHLKVGSLQGYGIGDDDGILCAAAAAALRYAMGTTGTDLAHVRRVDRLHPADFLILDTHCQRNLELLKNQRDGGRSDTLLAAIDRTRTAPGSRTLAGWLRRPLASLDPIIERHEAVQALLDEDAARTDLREALKEVYDLERLSGRIATGRANARDLVQLASSLERSAACKRVLAQGTWPRAIAMCMHALEPDPDLVARLQQTLVDAPPSR